jgi:hypothetical protein
VQIYTNFCVLTTIKKEWREGVYQNPKLHPSASFAPLHPLEKCLVSERTWVNHKACIMLYCHQKFIPLICGIRLAILDFVAGSSATAASVVVISNETLYKQIIILDNFNSFKESLIVFVIQKEQQL